MNHEFMYWAAYSVITRHAYRMGYEIGVSDYCDLDEPTGEAA